MSEHLNKHLQSPEIFKGISKARSDRTFTEEDLDAWESQARTALVKLSLTDNEGVRILLAQADIEIVAINKILLAGPVPGTDANEYLKESSILKERRKVWRWLRSFFSEASNELSAVERELSQQVPEEEVPDY